MRALLALSLRLPVACLCFWASLLAQSKPEIILFDEDDPIGQGYYDASFATASGGAYLNRGGINDKLLVTTNQAFAGRDSGLLQWRTPSGGAWQVFVASPGWVIKNVSGYSNLVLQLNGPAAMIATNLPRLGLESSPPDQTTALIRLADYLPDGIDGDTNTWQPVTIPLGDFTPKGTFSLARLKAVIFSQSGSDNVTNTLWFDDVRATAGETITNLPPASAPGGLVTRTGDRSVVLHWDRNPEASVTGWNVYRAFAPDGPFAKVTPFPVAIQSFADMDVTNDVPAFYTLRAVDTLRQEGTNSLVVSATPGPFVSDDAFLDYVQRTAVDYFWYEASPANGLVRDRSEATSVASTAATGFGLSAIIIGIEHGWIPRAAGRDRVLAILKTYWEKPQGEEATGSIGHQGWFYHFLDPETGLRSGTSELSSIDTTLLLGGVLDARQFFTTDDPAESEIRQLASQLYQRVNWAWMANGQDSLTMGWIPGTGFLGARWIGYNEASLLYLLALGAPTNSVAPAHWTSWTSGYAWRTNYNQAYVAFGPLFGHQYSHCWVDFRHLADAYMLDHGITYFENSRRAALAQRAYAIANPGHFPGYGADAWGLTACDGPGSEGFFSYIARGCPPAENDDGTIAPTAASASLPFAPEYSLPAMRFFYEQYRAQLWCGYGFRDAFNLKASWWDPDTIGIDQGPIAIMIENYRTQRVWRRFMSNPEIQLGLQRAGFVALPFANPEISFHPAQNSLQLLWPAQASRQYTVEFSPDLVTWFPSPTGHLSAQGASQEWLDIGPPATPAAPLAAPQRFYRVLQMGAP